MKITKKDVIWGYLGTMVNIGINIILLPIIIKFLTGQEIGLWYVYTSIGSIVILLDFGFAPTLARNIAYSWSGANQLQKEDVKYVNENNGPNILLLSKVLKTCKYIYLSISIIALIFLLSIGSLYINYIGRNFEGKYLMESWIIYVIAVFFNIYIGYFSSLLKGIGAIYEYNKAMVMSKLVQIVLSVILLLMHFSLIAVTLAYFVSIIINRMLCKRYFFRYENIDKLFKENKISIKFIEVKENFFIIWHNAWRDGLITVSNFLTTQANTILCSLFLDLTKTGIYSLSIQLVNVISTVASSFYSTYQPKMQEAYLRCDKEKSKKLMAMAMVIYTIIFVSGSIALSTIGISLVKIIKPGILIYSGFTFVICIYLFLYQHHSLYASYISNTNRIPYVKSYLLSAIIMIIFEVILFKTTDLKEWNLIIAPIIVQACYNNWKWPKFVMDELNTNIYQMGKLGISELYLKSTNLHSKAGKS